MPIETFSTPFGTETLRIFNNDINWWVSYWTNPYSTNPGSFEIAVIVLYYDHPEIYASKVFTVEFYLCILGTGYDIETITPTALTDVTYVIGDPQQ